MSRIPQEFRQIFELFVRYFYMSKNVGELFPLAIPVCCNKKHAAFVGGAQKSGFDLVTSAGRTLFRGGMRGG